jgi:tetratricopeptide (TPR) repeat protein
VRAAALLAACLLTAASEAAGQVHGRILVMPFENVTRDSRIVWLGEASAVLIADDLNALGASAIAREERREALDWLQLPSAGSFTDATVIRVGQVVGATQVIVGTLALEGDTLIVRARTIALEPGRMVGDVEERGPVPELFATFERLARKLAPAGAAPGRAIDRERPPVAAFENYVKGLLSESPGTAIGYLNTALQLDPRFARARLALWEVHTDQGDHDRALAAVVRVPADSPWAQRARFRTGLSQIHLKKYDEAFATYRALADQRPDAAVLNNLGVVQLRRGGTPQTGPATSYFSKAAEARATDADYFFNLGYAYWIERDSSAAIHWLREAVRRAPADGDAHFVLGAALAAAGSLAEANRERELARRLSSTYIEWEKKGEAAFNGLERLKDDIELSQANRVEESLAGGGQRDQQELARFYLDRGRRLFRQESDRAALADLNRTLFLSPYDAEAHLLVGRIHLRGGRAGEAIDALKISLWSRETAGAHAALARAYLETKDPEAARAEAERAIALDPASVEARGVLENIRR